jgi:hypothetical protein
MAFVYRDTFILSADKWSWILDIDLDQYKQPIVDYQQHINLFYNTIKYKTDTKSKTVKTILNSFLNRSDALLDSLIDMQIALHPEKNNNKNKRSLMDIGGNILSYAFGTLTNNDLQYMNDRINSINATDQKIVTLISDQITFINQTYKQTQINSHNIEQLRNVTFEIIAGFHAMTKEIKYSIQMLQDEMHVWLSVDVNLEQYEQIISDLTNMINNLQDIFLYISMGKLSTKLLPPEMLYNSLQQINEHLPPTQHLPTKASKNQLYVYYNIANTKAALYQGKVRILIEIPIITTKRHFNLYEALQLPTKLNNSHYSFYIDFDTEYKYLAVNSDRSLYIPMSESDIAFCTKNLLTICPPIRNILHKSQNSCLYGLFINDKAMINTKCKLRILNDHPPYFYRSKNTNDWLYSVSQTTKLFYECIDNSDITKYPTEITGTGILKVSPNCHVIGNDFRLLPHSNTYSLLTEQKRKHISPTYPVHEQLGNDSRFDINITEPQYNKLRIKLANIGHTDYTPKGLPLKEYIEHIDNIHSQINSYTIPTINKHTAHTTLLIVAIIIITVILLYKFHNIAYNIIILVINRIKQCLTFLIEDNILAPIPEKFEIRDVSIPHEQAAIETPEVNIDVPVAQTTDTPPKHAENKNTLQLVK